MADISVKNLIKSFEVDKNILDGLSFEIDEGERVGILGANGCGKTTLFRILVGEIDYDEGQVAIREEKRIGLISQIPIYPENYTVEDVLREAFSRQADLKAEIDRLEEQMSGEYDRSLLEQYDRAMAEFQALGGYDTDTELNKVANGLEISSDMRKRLFSELSGGEKTRVNLGRLILENTDILLLDEPTNHLDMKAVEWLEDYLLKFRGTVLAISHDRYFLDRIAKRTIEIVKGRAEFYSGNYSFYVVEKQRRLDEQLKQYEKEQKEIKRLSESADRLYQWGTGNKNLMKKSFAIRSRIERIQTVDRPGSVKKLKAGFSQRDFHGDEVLYMKGVSKSFGNRTLFSDIELLVQGGERIALIGDNGTGKSTLIKMIMGIEKPDTGFIRKGPAVKTAYLPQIIKFSHPERSILDTLVYEDNVTPQTARNRLGGFKFQGDDVFTPVAMLSGGEQSRLRLCMLMRDDVNFLILDEPTNHLDIASREWIEEAVESYGEALIFVSHDRYFIERFANRIWEIEDGRITDFRGGFEEFKRFKENRGKIKLPEKNTVNKPDKVEKPKHRGGFNGEKQLKKLEREISGAEQNLAAIEEKINEFSSDYEKLLELTEEKNAAEMKLEEMYAQWEELENTINTNS